MNGCMVKVVKDIEVIQCKVVKDMERAFPNGGGNFQQDLALCHRLLAFFNVLGGQIIFC